MIGKHNALAPDVKAHVNGLHLDPDLEELWKNKYKFYLVKLGLNSQKAIASADRTIRAFQKADGELAMTG